jgi:putative transposase
MRALGLVACQPRPWRPVTTRQGQAGPIPDLVNRDFSAEIPGQKMVGDITYSAQPAVMCSPWSWRCAQCD